MNRSVSHAHITAVIVELMPVPILSAIAALHQPIELLLQICVNVIMVTLTITEPKLAKNAQMSLPTAYNVRFVKNVSLVPQECLPIPQ